jgi:hypothetical protein
MNRDEIEKRHAAAKDTRIGITASLPDDEAAWEFLRHAWPDIDHLLKRLALAEEVCKEVIYDGRFHERSTLVDMALAGWRGAVDAETE